MLEESVKKSTCFVMYCRFALQKLVSNSRNGFQLFALLKQLLHPKTALYTLKKNFFLALSNCILLFLKITCSVLNHIFFINMKSCYKALYLHRDTLFSSTGRDQSSLCDTPLSVCPSVRPSVCKQFLLSHLL